VKLHSSNKQFTISVSTMPVVDASLTLSDTIVPLTIPTC